MGPREVELVFVPPSELDEMVGPWANPEEAAEFKQQIERLGRALKELSEREREMLRMRVLEDMKLREIGTVFSLSTERTRQVIRRTLQKLRDLPEEAPLREVDDLAPYWDATRVEGKWTAWRAWKERVREQEQMERLGVARFRVWFEERPRAHWTVPQKPPIMKWVLIARVR